ncbi:hypothetical protein ABKN59_002409 [Abortiporus biennis]
MEEEDIGLSNITRRSDSTTSSRRKPSISFKRTHKPSALSVTGRNSALPLPPPPVSPRKISRSNTLPRSIQNGKSDSLDGLVMESEKVAKLRRWIHALVIVDFDLEYGPKITKIYPLLTLSPSEAENISFSSFPDAPQVEQGSQLHSFRLRQQDSSKNKLDRLLRQDTDRPTSNDGFIYGYSHFTQRRDSSSRRGYQQRSLVILTPHPYPSLFYTLLAYLGQSFLLHGAPMLEVACHNMANWSDPVPGSTVELGFLGFVFTAELPNNLDTPQSPNSLLAISAREYDPDVHIISSLPPQYPPIVMIFEACLQHLWSIWECLVLGEPILIYGPSAAMTSQAVWWLRDILRPIPLVGDFRPFFTIHDIDHAALVNSRPPQPGLLLGVTNPLIERACKHWPHVISLGATPRKEKVPQTPKTPRTPWTPGEAPFSGGPPPGWRSKTQKRYISRDRHLLKKAEDACKIGDDRAKTDASTALRQHFSARTTALLVPLQRYLNTLLPTPSESAAIHIPSTPSLRTHLSSTSNLGPSTPSSPSSYTSLPSPNPSSPFNPSTPVIPPSPAPNSLRLKPFSSTAFLQSLHPSSHSRTLAPPSLLPFKSTAKQREFYEKWLRSRAFGIWLGEQEEMVKRVLEERCAAGSFP